MGGRRPFETGDESRNLAWLAIPTFGEAWHNNHHAFPTSARHGLGRHQIDPSARLIWDRPGVGALCPAAVEESATPRDSQLGIGCLSRGGAGLGLAIVRAVAEAHGGTAEIVRGQGATVRLRLPVVTSIRGES